MTPSALKNLLINSIVIWLLLLTKQICAQPDTVVVYEYIYNIDTIWIEPLTTRDTLVLNPLCPRENVPLILDTTRPDPKLVIFSQGNAATIPINRIIFSENNQKLKDMKKITFLGLTFLALYTTSPAQEWNKKNIGLFIKESWEGQMTDYKILNAKFPDDNFKEFGYNASKLSFGLKGNLSITPRLSFTPRLGYTHIRGMGERNATMYYDETEPKVDFISLGGSHLKSRFYFLSTDILINYHITLWKKQNFRIYGGERTDIMLFDLGQENKNPQIYKEFSKVSFNYIGGIGFDFWKRLFLDIEYCNNINSFVNNAQIKVRYMSLSASLGINLQ